MVLLSDLPRGLMQTMASLNEGVWWARPADVMQTGAMETYRWRRVVGDTIFGIGVVMLGWLLTDQPDAVRACVPLMRGTRVWASAVS